MSQQPSFVKPSQRTANTRRPFRMGEEFIREGDHGNEVFMILEGTVEIRQGMASSSPRTIAVLGPGDVIGEMALIDAGARSASAVAMDEVTVSVMSREEFERRAAEVDPLMRAIYGVTVKRLRTVLERSARFDHSAALPDWQK